MIKLCSVCRNIYAVIIGDNVIYYECKKCKHRENLSDEGSLQYTQIFDDMEDEHHITKRFLYDKANTVVNKECSNCGYPQLVYAILGNSLTCIYGCINCEKIGV